MIRLWGWHGPIWGMMWCGMGRSLKVAWHLMVALLLKLVDSYMRDDADTSWYTLPHDVQWSVD